MSAVILAARGLEYRYPGGIAALRGLDLEIARGRRLALLGANGCGKTTLLLHLNGTLKPAAGQVLLDGRPVDYGRRALDAWRNRVGLVMQEPDDQLFSATVWQDVSFGPLNQGLTEIQAEARVAAALETLRIAHLAERPTHALSFGQKKRAAIAGVLAMDPEILVLDEPTAGLDPRGLAQLLAALEQSRRPGRTLIFSTHNVDLAYAWADDVALLSEGRVLCQGPAPEILADDRRLHEAHLGTPGILALARALGVAGAPDGGDGTPPPRTQAELMARLTAGSGRAAAP